MYICQIDDKPTNGASTSYFTSISTAHTRPLNGRPAALLANIICSIVCLFYRTSKEKATRELAMPRIKATYRYLQQTGIMTLRHGSSQAKTGHTRSLQSAVTEAWCLPRHLNVPTYSQLAVSSTTALYIMCLYCCSEGQHGIFIHFYKEKISQQRESLEAQGPTLCFFALMT